MVVFLLLYLFGASPMDGGPPGENETCAFLPADDPCHLLPPDPPHCVIHNGVEICT